MNRKKLINSIITNDFLVKLKTLLYKSNYLEYYSLTRNAPGLIEYNIFINSDNSVGVGPYGLGYRYLKSSVSEKLIKLVKSTVPNSYLKYGLILNIGSVNNINLVVDNEFEDVIWEYSDNKPLQNTNLLKSNIFGNKKIIKKVTKLIFKKRILKELSSNNSNLLKNFKLSENNVIILEMDNSGYSIFLNDKKVDNFNLPVLTKGLNKDIDLIKSQLKRGHVASVIISNSSTKLLPYPMLKSK